MKRLLFSIILTAVFAVAALAQPSVDISAGAITNTPAGAQEFFYGIGGGFKFNKLYLGLDVFGDPSKANPKLMTRGRAFATYNLFGYEGWTFSAGAGGGKTGNEAIGFGQVNADFKRFSAFGRYGNQEFIEAEGFYAVIDSERFRFGPFYRFSGVDVQGAAWRLHQTGVRITLR